MKIGIITFHNSLNCGAVLQAWALRCWLRRGNQEAEIVNYGQIGRKSDWYYNLRSVRGVAATIYSVLRRVFFSSPVEWYRIRLYDIFLRRELGIGAVVSKDDLKKLDYSHLITGSDQVWHPVINEGDETYFLANVAEGVKRISYAPSFGVDSLDYVLGQKVSRWLSRFDAISVREPNGAAIVRSLCGREAHIVCDPTLLLSREDYERIERRPRFCLPKKYIAVYTVCGHPWAESESIKLGKRMGIPVVHLLGGQLARWYFPSRVKRITALGPAEWLWFINHSEYVITNSFHGTVFSMLFHRPFTVALNGRPSDERMLSLLSGTGLECCAIGQKDECRFVIEQDWRLVDIALKKKQKSGMEFLSNALGF